MRAAFQTDFSAGLHDLNPLMAGEGSPTPGILNRVHNHIPCILIHYIIEGRGSVTVNGKTYPVGVGQIFILNTKEDSFFVSDPHTPWSYRWVGFTGELSEHFMELPPVLDMDEDPFPSLKYLHDRTKPLDYLLAGDLFHLYCKFLHPRNRKRDYVLEIIGYIQKHYMDNLSVDAFAKKYGLDRRYLSRQFKKRTGYTIRGYITDTRLDAARHFLMQGYSGKEVAVLCGFSDTSNFYKAFKERRGMNPSDWRKDQLRKTENYWNKE